MVDGAGRSCAANNWAHGIAEKWELLAILAKGEGGGIVKRPKLWAHMVDARARGARFSEDGILPRAVGGLPREGLGTSSRILNGRWRARRAGLRSRLLAGYRAGRKFLAEFEPARTGTRWLKGGGVVPGTSDHSGQRAWRAGSICRRGSPGDRAQL